MVLVAVIDEDVLERIIAEYEEMPELSLTLTQAARLFGIDTASCELVLIELLARGRLRKHGDQYRRAHDVH